MNPAFVIARATVKGLFRERIFHAAIVLNVLFLLFSTFLATLTIVDQRKILLDFGFAGASLLGVGFAILLGSSFVRRELDSRTVYALLAKPVGRGHYLLGKIAGGFVVVTGLHAISFFTLALALWVQGDATPPGFLAVAYLTTLEGLLLLVIGVALSLACSSLFLGTTLTIAVFLVGRSAYSFLGMAEKAEVPLRALLRAFYFVFPALQRFDLREVVAYGRPYPADILPVSTMYFLFYAAAVTLLAILYFRRKDLP